MTFPTRLDLTVYMNLRDNEDVIELDGVTSQYVMRNPCVFPTTAFTVEFWIETEDAGKAGTPFSYAVTGDFDHIQIKDYDDIQLAVKGSTADTNLVLNDGMPHHVALSWQSSDGASVFYVDGKPRWSGTLATSALTSGGAVVIGQEQGAVGGSFVSASAFLGKIWDVRVWSDLRTETEIFDNMNLRLTGAESGLHLYWYLDEGTGTNADDETSNNYDGTINGSGVWGTNETPFFTDITDDINPSSLTMGSTLGKAVDTCQFTVRTWSGEPPREWDEIVIIDGAVRIFGGFATSINESDDADVLTKFSIGGSDYGIYLDYVLIKEEYENTDDQEMIIALTEEYAGWLGTDNVDKIKDYDRYRINRKTLRVLLNLLSDDADGNWYVDSYKELFFFSTYDQLAPYSVSDDPDLVDTFPCHGLVKHRGGSGLVNKIEVVGGWYLSPDTYFYLQGTGEDERISLPFNMRGPSTGGPLDVWRNDGTEGTPSWTVMTVKVGYIDTLGGANEVLHYYQEQVLEQQNAWPQLPNAVRIYGRYPIPLRTRMRDYNSFAFYKKWFDDFVSDRDITDKTSAIIRGKAELAKRSMGNLALTCHVREPGLRAGMQLPIANAEFDVDDNFIIQRVNAQVNINGRVDYSLSLGVWNDDLVDLLLQITRDTEPTPEWRDDEVLDEVVDYLEQINFSEVFYAPIPAGGPYYWCPPGSGNDPLIWDYGQWE